MRWLKQESHLWVWICDRWISVVICGNVTFEKRDMFWGDNEVTFWDCSFYVCVCVCLSQFKDAELLADNLESQLHLREQLCQREREAEEQVEQQRKALAALDNQQDLMQLQRNNQLSQLQAKLDETSSGALIWVPHIILSHMESIKWCLEVAHIFCMSPSSHRKGSGTPFRKLLHRKYSSWDRWRWRLSTSMKRQVAK